MCGYKPDARQTNVAQEGDYFSRLVSLKTITRQNRSKENKQSIQFSESRQQEGAQCEQEKQLSMSGSYSEGAPANRLMRSGKNN